jgi:putative transposase
MKATHYQDDGWRIPDFLWEEMQEFLPAGKPHPLGCHNPRKPLREAMDAIFFVLRTGCQWGALDATGICSHSRAHRRFQEWVEAGVFLMFWFKGLLCCEALRGIDWRWLSADGAMTKAPLGGEKTGPNPTDRAKLGAKRSLLVDAQGVPLAVEISGANRNDFKLLKATLENIQLDRPKPTAERPQGLCLDKGYDYEEARQAAKLFGFEAHIRTRGEEKEAKRKRAKKARRWVVERTHSWVNRFRCLLTRWNKKADNYLGLLHLALGVITYRMSGLLG